MEKKYANNRANRQSAENLKDQGFYHWPAWRRLRKLALQRDNYLCQLRISGHCTRLATEVHHTQPIDTHPQLALHLDNLTSCCWNCHELTKPRRSRPLPPVRIIKA